MIKINGTEVVIDGPAWEVVEELMYGIKGVYKALSDVLDEKEAKKVIEKTVHIACLSKNELMQEITEKFVDLAKKVNADRRED